MELLRIGESKLKVTLSSEDMERYSLDGDSMDYDNTETRSAVWQILDEAKHKTGFDAGGEKIFVQVYPARGGGCEMYVTKLEAEQKDMAPVSLVRGVKSIYRFATLNLLIDVCRRLLLTGYCEESAAYSEGGNYYLVIREKLHNSILTSNAISEYAFPEEYGTRRSGGVRLAFLREHGVCLEEHRAVERLAALAPEEAKIHGRKKKTPGAEKAEAAGHPQRLGKQTGTEAGKRNAK